MKTIAAMTLAVGIALAGTSAAIAMDDNEAIGMGQSMLTGALYNSLRAGGYPTEGIEKLTLGEVALLRSLFETDMAAAERNGQISLIFERAAAR